MNKTLMAAGLAVVLGACNSSKKSDGVDTSAVNPFFTIASTSAVCSSIPFRKAGL